MRYSIYAVARKKRSDKSYVRAVNYIKDNNTLWNKIAGFETSICSYIIWRSKNPRRLAKRKRRVEKVLQDKTKPLTHYKLLNYQFKKTFFLSFIWTLALASFYPLAISSLEIACYSPCVSMQVTETALDQFL